MKWFIVYLVAVTLFLLGFGLAYHDADGADEKERALDATNDWYE